MVISKHALEHVAVCRGVLARTQTRTMRNYAREQRALPAEPRQGTSTCAAQGNPLNVQLGFYDARATRVLCAHYAHCADGMQAAPLG